MKRRQERKEEVEDEKKGIQVNTVKNCVRSAKDFFSVKRVKT
jgi:hypothetical protein